MNATRRMERKPNPNAAHFPIFSYEDYDFQFKNAAYPVGLKSTYPEELIRRVAAAFISFQMGNSGVDYTYKNFLKDKPYQTDDGTRLDLRITRTVSARLELLEALIDRVAKSDDKRLGEIVCEWTFYRMPFAIRFIMSCANRGVFFETAAVARMALEQIAWASKIDQYDDENIIQQEAATRAIGSLSKSLPVAGKLYGWLSVHAHWAYDGHIKAWVTDDDGQIGALFATPEFKARSLALSILLEVIAEKAFMNVKSHFIPKAFMDDAGERKVELNIDDLLNYKRQVRSAELQGLLQRKPLTDLAVEIASHLPNDVDVNELTEMTLATA